MPALAKSGSEAAQWLGYQWPGAPIKSVMVEVLDQKKSKTKHHFFIGVKKMLKVYHVLTFLTVKKTGFQLIYIYRPSFLTVKKS